MYGCCGSLESHGGHEVKTMGDGIMAVFTSAGAALACAGAMQRAVAARHPHDDLRLSIRVGISAGDVASGEGDWHGPAVVEASRLCARAEEGQILVSEVAALLARGSGAGFNRSARSTRWS